MLFSFYSFAQQNELSGIKLNINNHIAFISGENNGYHVKFVEFYGISNVKNIYSYNTVKQGKLRVKLAVLPGLYRFRVVTKNSLNQIIFIRDKIITIK